MSSSAFVGVVGLGRAGDRQQGVGQPGRLADPASVDSDGPRLGRVAGDHGDERTGRDPVPVRPFERAGSGRPPAGRPAAAAARSPRLASAKPFAHGSRRCDGRPDVGLEGDGPLGELDGRGRRQVLAHRGHGQRGRGHAGGRSRGRQTGRASRRSRRDPAARPARRARRTGGGRGRRWRVRLPRPSRPAGWPPRRALARPTRPRSDPTARGPLVRPMRRSTAHGVRRRSLVASLDQPLEGEGAHRLRQLISRHRAADVVLDERPLRQIGQCLPREDVAADRRRGIDGQTAAEHGEAFEEEALPFVEQVIRPSDRVAQLAVMEWRRRVDRVVGRQELEPLIETPLQLIEAERARPGRRQLDRERQPVEPGAQGGDPRAIGRGGRRWWRRRPPPGRGRA